MRPPAAHKLTYDDFLWFPDDGRRHELIDGEHFVTPSPSERHQRVSLDLTLALGNYLRTSRVGSMYCAPFDVVLSDYDVVEPDLLVNLADQQDILTEKNVRGAPAIVIEILSPGTRARDETLKRDLYARAGVREYWMVDPDARAVRVCRWPAIGAPAR
jgi:Uma2 family endonuclease